ncbi:MAG: hypothetical protein JWP14_1409, partial [Frankiales bacterium]|nr:hypothetical protein [Frankiales bacterium]
SVVGKRVADNVMRADAGLVAACGRGPYPTQFHACLEAVMAEQRKLVFVESDLRLIESSATDNANEAGLKAGLRQGLEGLTAALTPLRPALQEGSRVHYYSSHVVARDATGTLLGYALALSVASHVQPPHQAADARCGRPRVGVLDDSAAVRLGSVVPGRAVAPPGCAAAQRGAGSASVPLPGRNGLTMLTSRWSVSPNQEQAGTGTAARTDGETSPVTRRRPRTSSRATRMSQIFAARNTFPIRSVEKCRGPTTRDTRRVLALVIISVLALGVLAGYGAVRRRFRRRSLSR